MNVNLTITKDYRKKGNFLVRINKPNFQNAKKMSANAFLQKDYENEPLSGPKKQTQFKANSNPIKANFQKAQMNVNSFITKDYRKNEAFTVRINKPNFSKGPK